jgi:hypothetical protein
MERRLSWIEKQLKRLLARDSHITQSVWVDIDFPLVARTTGAGLPNYNTLQGNLTMLQWAVNDALQLDTRELIHGWQEGDDAHWHCHIITGASDGTDRRVAFSLEFTKGDLGGVLAANITLTSPDYIIPAGTAAKTHLLVSIGVADLTGYHIGGHIKARFKRIAPTTGTAPSTNPFCEMVQAHVLINSAGSRGIGTK